MAAKFANLVQAPAFAWATAILILHKFRRIIRIMITESLSHAREKLGAIMDRVVAEKVPIRIKRRGAEGVVLVSESEWSSMEETLCLLSSPANARELMNSIRALDAGEGAN